MLKPENNNNCKHKMNDKTICNIVKQINLRSLTTVVNLLEPGSI